MSENALLPKLILGNKLLSKEINVLALSYICYPITIYLFFVEYHFIPYRKSYGKQILFYACFCSPTESQINFKDFKKDYYTFMNTNNQKTKILQDLRKYEI